MADPLRLYDSDPREAEEKLGHALITRGLITQEEFNRCKSPPNRPAGPRQLLETLVRGGYLAESQKKRVWQEIDSITDQVIPGYQMIEPIGQGSMGKVFKARQVSMDRLVAIKILRPGLARRKDFLERHKREAQMAARLSHPNLINAIDVGQAGEIHYFVMELAEGETLRDTLDRGETYSEEEALNIIVKVVKALEHAHAKGLVHRDVKPANIVVMKDGTVKLADLGMAQDTADAELIQSEKGQRIGTPYYMAPEQIEAEDGIDGRTDLYGVGATLFHMVTGRPPFPSQRVDKVLHDHLHCKPEPAYKVNDEVSKDLSAVIAKLLQKKPERRYASATELLADLYDLLAGERPTIALGPKGKKKNKAEVEIEEEEGEPGPGSIPHSYWLLVAVLAGFLVVSIVVNILLWKRHGGG
jgi:serine/threonine-protein kinase